MIIPRLSLKSLWNRRGMAFLTIIAVAVSVMLLLGVEKVRTGARASFTDTISATDLIVGARSGAVQLLLYSVFRIGDATNNVSWESYQDIAAQPQVDWIVPLALGDSHQGFRVVGTSAEFFDRYHYRGDRPLTFAEGHAFSDLFDAVIGADVAATLGYQIGTEIIVSHGMDRLGIAQHDDKPFTVVGILGKTGTPVDRSVHISMEAIEAIHVDWRSGAPPRPGEETPIADVRAMDLTPTSVTAALVGLKSRLGIFALQRYVNEYQEEALTAILPGVALFELWGILGAAETALIAVSAMVVATAILGMITTILSTLNERRREMAILRAVGARPMHIFGLLVAEAGLLAFIGTALGVALLYIALLILRPIVDARFGLYLPITAPTTREWIVLGIVVLAGFIAGAIPALRAYWNSLADGIIVRT
jgi:putative ABC transport system permease protein